MAFSLIPSPCHAMLSTACLAATLVVLGCGGGSSSTPPPAPQPPASPTLVAPAMVTSGRTATASISSPLGTLTYAWTVTGGTFTSGATTATGSSVTFTAGGPGSLNLACTCREGNGPQSLPGSSTVNVIAAPAITTFTASPTRIANGANGALYAVFTGGTGSINQGVGAVTSGTPANVSPSSTTPYILTVSNVLNDTATATASIAVDVTTPLFLPTGAMTTGRYHQATRLGNGKVIITGGVRSDSTRTAESFDPAIGAFTPLAEMLKTRTEHTATLLGDGRILLTGGDETGYTSATQSTTEWYVPATNTFVQGPLLSAIRFRHTATLLNSGKVLITGGEYGRTTPSTVFDFHATAELFDPLTNTFSPAGSMATPRAAHTATLLSSGKVLIAGGVNSNGNINTAELYDPATNLFSPAGNLTLARSGHSATRLDNNQVLILGDVFGSASAELYNPNTNTFTATGNMATGRVNHSAVLLANGKVLVAGGYYSPTYSYPVGAELFDPTTGTFTLTANMASGRSHFTLTRLASGRVLVAGGWNGGSLSTCELFDPADALAGLTR